MDIIDNLMKAIPLCDGESSKILQELLVRKLQEQAELIDKPQELTKEQLDMNELLNYNGG